jgi:uncharacterized membrane protein
MNLSKRLRIWTSQGLITASQAEAILAYEKHAVQKPWALYGVVGIGLTAIATGVISLVAANWEHIPAALKLVLFFLLEGGLGAMFVRHASRPGIRREAFLTLFALFVLAGIGLVAQIYHLHSNGWSGLLFWLSLILPATLLAQSRLLAHVWFGGLATTLCIWVASDSGPLAVAVTIAYAVAAVGLAHLPGLPLNARFQTAARDWGLSFVVAGLSVMASVFWSEGVSEDLRRLPYLPWAGCALASTVAALATPPYAKAARWRAAVVAMLVAVTAFYTLPIAFELKDQPVLSTAFFILVWALAGLAAVAADRQRLFDLISFVIAVRFVIVYFEVFGSLAATGIGLILSGVVILGVASVWYKFRRTLAAWAAGGR